MGVHDRRPPGRARPRAGSRRPTRPACGPRRRRSGSRPASAPCCGRTRRRGPCRPATPEVVAGPVQLLAGCGSWSRPRAACRTTRSRGGRPAAPTPRSSRPGRAAAARRARALRVSGSTALGPVGDPVGVAAPQRAEAGVEAVAPPRPRRRTRTSAGRMPLSRRTSDSASGPPASARRRRRAPPGRARARRRRCARRTTTPTLGDPQHRRQRGGQLALHGPQPRLGGPAVEVGAVVGEVEPDAHDRAILLRTRPRLVVVSTPAIVLICAEHPDEMLDGLRALRQREYDVRLARSCREALETTHAILADGGTVAMFVSESVLPDAEVLHASTSSARRSRPARRVIAAHWDRFLTDGPDLRPGMAKGKYDAYLLMPRGVRDEEFHNAITDLLSDWGSTVADPEVVSVKIVSPVRDALTLGIRDFLDRMGMPSGVYEPDSDGGRYVLDLWDGEPAYPLVYALNRPVDPRDQRPRRRDRAVRRPHRARPRPRRRRRRRGRRPGRARGRGVRRLRGPLDGDPGGRGDRRPGRHQLDDPQLPRLPARHLRHAAGARGPATRRCASAPGSTPGRSSTSSARRPTATRTCCAPRPARCAPARW